MSWLKEQAALLKEFLSGDFRRILVLCALGMVLAVLLGTGVGLLFPEQAVRAMESFMNQIAESGVVTEEGDLSVFALLMNNWRAMLMSAAYGFIPFLFLPVLSLLMNGMLLGLLAAIFAAGDASLLVYLAGILPHGIFEIPALVLSIACGVYLCRNMCLIVVSSPDREPLLELLEKLLRVIVLVIAPLTMAAAFVECYITPVVMGLLM